MGFRGKSTPPFSLSSVHIHTRSLYLRLRREDITINGLSALLSRFFLPFFLVYVSSSNIFLVVDSILSILSTLSLPPASAITKAVQYLLWIRSSREAFHSHYRMGSNSLHMDIDILTYVGVKR